MNWQQQIRSWWGLILALVVLTIIVNLSFPAVLINGVETHISVAGQRMLAILAFAVIVWISEVVSYELSAIMILLLIAFLIGFAPNLDHPEQLYGTSKALEIGLRGFSSSALALVAGALFISAAMVITGLDRRIALYTLNAIGTSAKAVFFGVILVTLILSLLVPSATARCACMVPIILGIINAFKLEKGSQFAAGLMICVAQATNIWNVGILTAAAQNIQTIGFIQTQIGVEVGWMTWFIAGAPWALVMSAVLFFLIRWLLPPEQEIIPGGAAIVKQQLAELGSITRNEITLLTISVLMLVCWAMGGVPHLANIWHNFFLATETDLLPAVLRVDTTTVTSVGLMLLLLPKLGVMEWKQLQQRTAWGTLVVFAIGISLGSALVSSKAGEWMAGWMVTAFGLQQMSIFAVFAILSLFMIVVHLGFASATAISAAMIPIMIPVALSLTNGDQQAAMGLVVLLGFTVSFGMVLPINSPQGMLCLGTDTFTPRQYAKIGIPLTIIGFVLLLVFAKTYWALLGLI